VEEDTHSCVTLAFVEFASENLQMREKSLEYVNQAGNINMDTLANMLVMMKNASQRGHVTVTVPHSKLKVAIANCLKDNGYVKSIEVKTKKGFQVLELGLVYDEK
jgi:hypothetical protein